MIPVNEVITGNCAEVMAGWPDECIDLTVTSPPYDNLRDYEGYEFDFEAIAAQLWRITKPGGVVVWVVGDATVDGSETGTSFKQALFFMQCGFNLHDTMIYQKANILPRDPRIPRYYQEFEYMFILSKSKPKTCNHIREICKHAGSNNVPYSRSPNDTLRLDRKVKNKNHIVKDTKVKGNIWKYAVTRNAHPAPFPEALASDHILSWSNEGDTVLDCFCGSGTTLKIAKQTGRQFIGIDISENYCAITRKRVEGAQPPLFLETVTPANNGRTMTGATAPEGQHPEQAELFK